MMLGACGILIWNMARSKMDELQATFTGNKLFVWGISSDINEVFTPIDRLGRICSELLLTKPNKKTHDIELAVTENTIVVPHSMKLFYDQFVLGKTSARTFLVQGIEIDENSVINNYLGPERKHGVLFGDSYEFFRMCLKFSFSLVMRQRFVPYYEGKQSRFIPNLDNSDDAYIFAELAKKAPLSIKQRLSTKTDDALKASLDYFTNLIILDSLKDASINIKSETKSDQWVLGLLGKNMAVDKNIQEGLKQWLVTRKVNHDLGYNMLFKLEEPYEESGLWKISFNLQSKKDPSLIISLRDLWMNPKKAPIRDIKLHLLRDLGTAAKFSKTIEKALYRPNPHEIEISGDDALSFITNDSFLLKDTGFSVHIPKITNAKLAIFKVKIRFKDSSKFAIKGTGTIGNALFDFDYSIAIGEVELTKEEFYQLSKSKEKLINVKGRWVEVNKNDVIKVLDYFEKKKKLSLIDTFIATSSNTAEFEIDQVTVPTYIEEKINGLFDFKGIKTADVPDAFSGQLRHYQMKGFSWMLFLKNLGFGGILADDMGLGKTIQAIAYLLACPEKPSLVICPMSVMGNWQRELQKFSPSLKIYIHHGAKRLNKSQFNEELKDKNLVISSYATARMDEEIFGETEWSTILLDEAQNIKNPAAKQTISINKLKSKNRFCLTGTPIENRLSELWSIMNFANPGLLSSWSSFKKNFAEPIELQNDEKKKEILKKLINPFVLRRMKTDKNIISDLPAKTEVKEYCSLTKEQASLYQAIVDYSLSEIKNKKENRRALIMAALIKLKQICNHPSNYLKDSREKLSDRSGKVERLREILEIMLQNNEKCLIFTQYKEMGDLLQADLAAYFDTPVCFLHGQQSRKKREAMIDYFQSDETNSPKIFILSLKAGGLGINLTKASNVIHFDRWWNPAVENQATDRAFRIGQEKNVFVYKFITTGTIEEKIDEMIERKTNLSVSMLSKGETAITELDDIQLKELFSLRKEHLEG